MEPTYVCWWLLPEIKAAETLWRWSLHIPLAWKYRLSCTLFPRAVYALLTWCIDTVSRNVSKSSVLYNVRQIKICLHPHCVMYNFVTSVTWSLYWTEQGCLVMHFPSLNKPRKTSGYSASRVTGYRLSGRLWSPPSLLFNGCRRRVPRE